MDNRYIGIFDSGLGGLTAVKEMMKTLPGENIIYFGDTARVPYGSRSPEVLCSYVKGDIEFLLSHDVKLVLSACGTASTVALPRILGDYEVPLFGVLSPAAREAAEKTKNGNIGVLGTAGTIFSGKFKEAIVKINPKIKVFQKACPMFVPLVENGYAQSDVSKVFAQEYLTELKEAGIDTLILGCTHYPLLKGVIGDIMGEKTKLIDSGAAAARAVAAYLKEKDMLSSEKKGEQYKFFVSDSPESFEKLGSLFLGRDMGGAEIRRIL